ncbi:Csu type fimbrial protein [Sphingosinicella xenopeptidilytica]
MVRFAFVLLAAGVFWSSEAVAQTYGSCTVGTAGTNLGNASSFVVGTSSQSGSGGSGMACSAISLITTSYLKLRVETSTFVLTGPSGQTIPFVMSGTAGGTAIGVGTEFDFSGFDLLNLFSGPGGAVPVYFRTTPATGLAAGSYTGSVSLRWYFSVCTLGVVACLAYSNSPGATRNIFGVLSNWGSGVPVTINVSLTVENDCIITAPDLAFGAAPLVGTFNPVTRTISIRCSAGAAYTVGLDNGANASGSTRRMRRGATSDYLTYEIYRNTITTDRWGNAGVERRSSTSADSNPGIYDGSTLQGFSYRAAIDPGQPTPPTGTYTDTIILDVTF